MKGKYIILYGYNYSEEFYGLAKNLKEAKKFIEDCIIDTGCELSDIKCFEVKSCDLKLKINVKISAR